MQYVHSHSLKITQMLKSGYSNDQQKLNRLQNYKITKKYFNEIALMQREYLEKWIGAVTCQKILEALKNDIIGKRFTDTQPRRFCKGRYWMLGAFSTILWKFSEDNNYADKTNQRKFEVVNGYYHIAILENVRV